MENKIIYVWVKCKFLLIWVIILNLFCYLDDYLLLVVFNYYFLYWFFIVCLLYINIDFYEISELILFYFYWFWNEENFF